VVRKIETFEGDILVTYDTHPESYLQTREGRNLPVPHCIRGTEGWQLNCAVQAALERRTWKAFEKPTFGSTELVHYIKGKYGTNDLDIELIGLCTDICVVSNALLLKAEFLEARISVDSSCCAGVTVDSHNAALTTMKMCQIDVK
jgi:nicotinamidase-related amidase